MLPTFSDYVAKQAPKTHADSVHVLTTWLKATKPLALKNLAEEPQKPFYDFLVEKMADAPSVKSLAEDGSLELATLVDDHEKNLRRFPSVYLAGLAVTQAVIVGVTLLAYRAVGSARGRAVALALTSIATLLNFVLHSSLYAGARADYQDFLKNGLKNGR